MKQPVKTTRSKPANQQTNTFLVLALIIIAFFTGYLFFKVQRLEKNMNTAVPQQQQTGSGQQQPTAKVNIKNVDLKGEPYIGDPNAQVVMAYWLDYQCPFCKKFETDALPTLIEKYVRTGKLKIVFKDFQFLGPDSQTAGLAEEAVWELSPQSFEAWNKAMYEKQDDENAGWGNKADIIALTRTIPGIDADNVSTLMDQKKDIYQKELDEDKAEGGNKFGVTGTPGFVIGDQSISGAQPTSVFTQLIDSMLQKK